MSLRKAVSRARAGSAAKGAVGPDYYNLHFSTKPQYRCAAKDSMFFSIWNTVAAQVPITASVLEVGCGTGQLAEILHHRGITKYVGFDFAEVGVELAKERVPEFSFQVDDARKTDLYAGEYDFVVSTEVFEHLDNDRAVLAKIRPGTPILFTVPSRNSHAHVRFFPTHASVNRYYFGYLDRLVIKPLQGGRWFLISGKIPKR